MFSESLNVSVAKSEPVLIYFRYRVGCVVDVPALYPITSASTPEVAPVIVTGVVVL